MLTSRLLRAPELLPQLAVLPEVVEAVINGGHGSDLYELNAYVDSIRRSAAAQGLRDVRRAARRAYG